MFTLYPHGGPHYVLHHWTRDEQMRLTVARSPEAALAVVRSRKFTARDFPECRLLERIQIVQPDAEFQFRMRLHREQQEREAFAMSTLSDARRYHELLGEYPQGFGRCRSYQNKPGNEGLPGQTVADDPEHIDCNRCHAGTVGQRARIRDMYALALAAPPGPNDWWRYRPDPGFQRSRAPLADATLPLYVMVASYGPHSGGCSAIEAAADYGNDRPLFYYQRPEPLPVWLAAAVEAVAAVKTKAETVAAERETSRQKQNRSRNLAEIEALRKRFGA